MFLLLGPNFFSMFDNLHIYDFIGLYLNGFQVLNACVPSCQWRGVFWVFEQLRKNGLKPNGASYGLAMEVVHTFFPFTFYKS